MDSGLEGRTALVTGGTRGIGFAIASALRGEGMDVAILARDRDALDAAVNRLGDDHALGVVADLTDRAQVDRAVDEVVEWRGQLNVVVNNAGPPMQAGPIAELGDDNWMSTFDAKTMGAVRIARAVLPRIADDGSGRIINITGVTHRSLIPNAGITGMANGAMSAFTRYLAAEAAERRVLVNAVCPGLTRTEGWVERAEKIGAEQGISGEQFLANMVERLGLQLGRWAEPAEIANYVTFLASDLATFMTGQVLLVDGGQSKAVT